MTTPARFKRYDPHGVYVAGEDVYHKGFGYGVVRGSPARRRMEVEFVAPGGEAEIVMLVLAEAEDAA